jgi:hypothetical protein
MKKISLLLFLFLFYLTGVAYVSAHVGLDYPLGGETFSAGDTITIKWHIEIDHGPNNWDLYFSSDGGANWEDLQLNIEKSQLDYLWTVPQILTENARIKVVQDNDNYQNLEDANGDFTITNVQTSIGLENKIPTIFKLHTNYPNPFNPTTTIDYEIPVTTNIDLSIYNLLGQKVQTLVYGRQNAGYHTIDWNASHLSSGTNFIKLQTDEFIQVKKSILLK